MSWPDHPSDPCRGVATAGVRRTLAATTGLCFVDQLRSPTTMRWSATPSPWPPRQGYPPCSGAPVIPIASTSSLRWRARSSGSSPPTLRASSAMYGSATSTRRGPPPFAAQPRLHNPVGAPTIAPGRFRRLPGRPIAALMSRWCCGQPSRWGCSTSSNTCANVTGSGFPPPYEQAVRRSPSRELPDEYRRYACFLNDAASTTVSRHIFELLACRTPVVSTPSRALEELFGDAVITVETQADARTAVEALTGDAELRDRVGQIGYRAVMSRHTYGHRVDQLLDTLGILSPPRPVP